MAITFAQKIVFMQLRAGTPNRPASYDVDGVIVSPNDSGKDLEIQYNSSLDFSEHYRVQSRQATIRTHHIFKGLCSNNESILRAYKSYVMPMPNFTCRLLARPGAFSYHRIQNSESSRKE